MDTCLFMNEVMEGYKIVRIHAYDFIKYLSIFSNRLPLMKWSVVVILQYIFYIFPRRNIYIMNIINRSSKSNDPFFLHSVSNS